MKKLISVLISLFFVFSPVLAASDVVVYSNDSGKFGLKDENNNIITEADYKKLIRLGDNAFIALKRSKYGLISKDGTELVKFKYTHAARLLGKYVKFKMSINSTKTRTTNQCSSGCFRYKHTFVKYKKLKYIVAFLHIWRCF